MEHWAMTVRARQALGVDLHFSLAVVEYCEDEDRPGRLPMASTESQGTTALARTAIVGGDEPVGNGLEESSPDCLSCNTKPFGVSTELSSNACPRGHPIN
ncbi:hypothetical protein N7491_000817 [Penicillium cf. griseofulvum]|uniref:Uncharacterized protein n=1 Tax=Penicillium cf. griseofulvum TaxID=2972120 RepID=A0A9W9INT3_9EURO|nr:hypothetical protein N7472_011224 [Penicillium cf. griseofulvum]KAJ5442979.1 hypothetical protein N7445_004730 [Penicillium cf. griseofulvum]KAJ5451635.1 hypothetical protein N7491_000817 [Penicillium cf. griseofulvum]